MNSRRDPTAVEGNKNKTKLGSWRHNLALRLGVGVASTAWLGMLILVLLAYAGAVRLTYSAVDAGLDEDLRDLREAAGEGPEPSVLEAPLPGVKRGDTVLWRGQLVHDNMPESLRPTDKRMAQLPSNLLAPFEAGRATNIIMDGGNLQRGSWLSYWLPGQKTWRLSFAFSPPYVFAVGRNMGGWRQWLFGFGLRMVLVGLIVAIFMAAVTSYAVRRSFKPLRTIATAASRITTTTINVRIPIYQTDQDLFNLATVLNAMIDRLAAAISRERRFVDDAAHELRTPLAALSAEIDVTLRRSRTADEYRASLEAITVDVSRLNRLANDLLFLARTEGDQHRTPTDATTTSHQLVSLAKAVHTAVQGIAVLADAAGTEVEVDIPQDTLIGGNALPLERLVTNLVQNAIQAGSHHVMITACKNSETSISMAVLDDGPGIAAEVQANLFERFSRSDTARSSGRGTGLGLAICQAIVERYGGSITVASNPGRGTCFTINLPLAYTGQDSGN